MTGWLGGRLARWLGGCGGWQGGLDTIKLTINVIHSFLKAVDVSFFEL